MRKNTFNRTIKFRYLLLLCLVTFILPEWLAAQSIIGLNPDEGMQGETLELTITGQNTNFMQATTVFVRLQQGSNTAIMPQTLAWSSDDIINATFSFSFNNDPGVYDLRVYDDVDGIMYLYNAFDLQENPVQPELVDINPDHATQGDVLNLLITGQNTHFQSSSTTISLKQGTFTIAPLYKVVHNETQITAHFAFNFSYPPGTYDLKTQSNYDGTLYLYDAFELQPGITPGITGMVPAQGMAGTLLNFDIFGENTHFDDAPGIMAWLQNSQDQIIGLAFDVLTNTHIQGTIILPWESAPGSYDLHVYNSLDGDVVLEDAFNLLTNPDEPSVSYITPDSAYLGNSVEMSAYTVGTWFEWAPSVSAFLRKTGSFQYIYAQGLEVVNNEELSVSFNIGQQSVAGYYDFHIVDDLDGDVVGTEMFYVIDTITGIQHQPLVGYFNIYPNPATDVVSVSTERSVDHCEIIICDLNGRQKMNIKGLELLPGQSLRLNIAGLSKGIYVLKIITRDAMISKKLIKQ